MKTVVRIMTVTAVTVVALSFGVPGGADRPAANRGRELQFELADGTVITGRIDAKVIAFRMPSGSVLKISVADLTVLNVGLNDRPGFVQRVESLVKALDSGHTRQDALRELIALGPAVAPIVKRHSAGDASARLTAVTQILKAYKTWRADHPDAPRAMARPLELQSKILAGGFTLVGTVTAKQFRIAAPYGPVTVKLDEVHRIYPAIRLIPSELGRLVVELRDKTCLKGMVLRQSLRVQTRHGAMAVPFRHIREATFAADGKGICVQCWGFDRIVGTLGASTTISLKTDKGRADLSAGKIAVMVFWPLTLKGHSDCVHSVAFSPDGKSLASGSDDATIKLWDTAGRKELLTFKGYSRMVLSVAFSPDGRRLASGSEDHTIKLWDTVTGRELLALGGHSERVYSVAFSPDGKRLASGSMDHTIKLWDSVEGKGILTLKGHSGYVYSVVFSPDGKRLASGSLDNTIKLWGAVTGKKLLTLRGHSNAVRSVAFSPDGKRLASGSNDKTVKLWDIAGAKALLTLKGHSRTVLSVAFSPDGKALASASKDGTIKLWDTAGGKELITLNGHSLDVWSVAFSPDGKRLASGSQDKTIMLWDALDWTKSPKKEDGGH